MGIKIKKSYNIILFHQKTRNKKNTLNFGGNLFFNILGIPFHDFILGWTPGSRVKSRRLFNSLG